MPDISHPLISHAIPDPGERESFVRLVEETAFLLRSHGCETTVVFHGTVDHVADRILSEGMRPTMTFASSFDGEEYSCQGSYWGRVEVAAWWAVSAAANRGGRPVLIAIGVDDLQSQADIGVDIPTRDFPQEYVTAFDDPETCERWRTGNRRTWEDSLLDLGSVSAIHEGKLAMDSAMIYDNVESLWRILVGRSFSA